MCLVIKKKIENTLFLTAPLKLKAGVIALKACPISGSTASDFVSSRFIKNVNFFCPARSVMETLALVLP